MIEVVYQDRLGNNLFQYAFGRMLAEELGFALVADPIPGFSSTREPVTGLEHEDGPPETLEGQNVDLAGVLADRTPRRITVDGHFQRYEYYAAHKAQIRSTWIVPDPQPIDPPHPDDLVMHIRRGDYVYNQWALPADFYLKIAEERSFRRLVIITDEPRDPFFWQFRKHNPAFVRGRPLEDFWFLMHARRLVISPSSFSWWAAFLSSHAEEIVFPDARFGAWTLPGVDLRVTDEARYTAIDCSRRYRVTAPAERLFFAWFMVNRWRDPARIRRVLQRTFARWRLGGRRLEQGYGSNHSGGARS